MCYIRVGMKTYSRVGEPCSIHYIDPLKYTVDTQQSVLCCSCLCGLFGRAWCLECGFDSSWGYLHKKIMHTLDKGASKIYLENQFFLDSVAKKMSKPLQYNDHV